LRKIIYFLVVICFFFKGCSQVISPKLIEQSDREISFAQLKNNPDELRGRIVILGGVIVTIENRVEGSWLEVYQTETSRVGEPVNLDFSQGRFLLFHEDFLDPEIFHKGRKITAAGKIKGEETRKIGNAYYSYPLIHALEIHLWEEKTHYRHEPYPWYPLDYPYPYFSPYSPYRYYPWW
jgi:outer membrane lipoprotein